MRLVSLAAAAALLAGCSGGGDDEAARTVTVATTVEARDTVSQAVAPATQGSIAAAVARVLPSVVSVQTTSFGGGEGGGSGVVFDRSGLILTNNHVVEGTTSVTVSFNDGPQGPYAAEVVGTEPARDLAVLHVEAENLEPVQLADSSLLRLGDPVIAIGFPLDLGVTVTSGIVSGLNRTIESPNGDLTGLLQTDAAINPGNSGGPLVDRAGRLVGINTAGIREDGTEGIGFAIAIDGALPVIERLSRGAPSGEAWLGISFGSVDSESAAVQLGLDSSTRGAAVTVVYPGGPGAKAELAVGDVITVADDVPIRNANALQTLIAKRKPGDELDLEVIDSRGPRLVTITLAPRTPGEVP
ncbi:MAG: trypsin-like serine protease [Thermoleophilia bacterium]|nr:trypsin-like serine protease [Thermoleophilia bacterium]